MKLAKLVTQGRQTQTFFFWKQGQNFINSCYQACAEQHICKFEFVYFSLCGTVCICVTEHVIMLEENLMFDKQDDKNSSIFFFVTKLVEQNVSFLIKSCAKLLIFIWLNNTCWVICCYNYAY